MWGKAWSHLLEVSRLHCLNLTARGSEVDCDLLSNELHVNLRSLCCSGGLGSYHACIVTAGILHRKTKFIHEYQQSQSEEPHLFLWKYSSFLCFFFNTSSKQTFKQLMVTHTLSSSLFLPTRRPVCRVTWSPTVWSSSQTPTHCSDSGWRYASAGSGRTLNQRAGVESETALTRSCTPCCQIPSLRWELKATATKTPEYRCLLTHITMSWSVWVIQFRRICTDISKQRSGLHMLLRS